MVVCWSGRNRDETFEGNLASALDVEREYRAQVLGLV